MTPDTPKYVAPQPDPALAILTQQNEQHQTAAIQDRVSAASARLMTMYGTRVAQAGVSAPVAPISAPSGGFGTPLARV